MNLIPSLNISLMIVHIIYELYTLYCTLCDRGGRFNPTLRNLLFAFSRQLYFKNRGGEFLQIIAQTFRYEGLSTVTTRIRLTDFFTEKSARLPLPGTSCFSIPVFISYFQRTKESRESTQPAQGESNIMKRPIIIELSPIKKNACAFLNKVI